MKKFFLFSLVLLLIPLAACANEAAPNLAEDARGVCDLLVSGDFSQVSAQFDDAMAAAVSTEALAQGWASATAQAGAFVEVDSVVADPDSRSAALTLTHENGQIVLSIAFDADGRISGLLLRPAETGQEATEKALPEGATERKIQLFAGTERELRAALVQPAEFTAATPCVVFAHGSGASDMDETIGPNKPFRDLAYDLAANGIASLRFDKITFAHPEGAYETVRDEYLTPVQEALRVLKAETGAERVYLAGHSQGGMLTPWLVRECGFDGGVALAGTALPIWEISYNQNMLVIAEMPAEQQEEVLQQIEGERQRAEALLELSDEEARKQTVFGMNAYYLKFMEQLDQTAIAAETDKPFFFLWGEADFQVSRSAFDSWKERLGEDGPYTYITYPGLNHLFMPAEAEDSITNVQAAYARPATVDEAVSRDIAQWIFGLQPAA